MGERNWGKGGVAEASPTICLQSEPLNSWEEEQKPRRWGSPLVPRGQR